MSNINDACKTATPAIRWLEIAADQGGQRIDNYLFTQLKGVPKSHIYRIVRRGEVRVNKGRIKPEYRLQAGDKVRIPPLRQGVIAAAEQPGPRILELIRASVLYEDNQLLVLNKPAGIAVHGGSGVSYGIIEALRALHPEAPFLELVHRLDRETSGCLLIAKRRSLLRALHEALREGEVNKEYLALVKGRWQGKQRMIDAALRKNMLASGERIVKVTEAGKPAASLFRPSAVFPEASLMRVKLLSGRTHQIRVHATYSGHPVAGDDKYGDDEFNRRMRSRGLSRLFLHAHTLTFDLPSTGQKLTITASLPDDLEKFLTQLQQSIPSHSHAD